MKVSAWRRYAVKPLMLRLTPTTIATFVGSVSLLAVAGGAIGYAVGAKTTVQKNTAAPIVVNSNIDTAEAQQLRAMQARVAEMQAQLLRLDALSQHVAESAHISVQEFSSAPAKDSKGGPLTQDLSVLGEHNIDLRLQELSQRLAQKETQLQALDSVLFNKRLQNNQSYLANLPVRNAAITSTFGYRTDPFTGRAAFHGGIDFSGAQGADIYSVASGVVSFAGVKAGYGNVVEVNHGNGYTTRYAHAQSIVAKAGDLVAKDQLIAYMGSTGRSTGTHLHYEVLLNGKQIDPASYVAVALKK
ncbi:M23 family metallopeptidase [Agitococcus lubricus]|uniref:Murein DD-endopeptidase MepM/ murein hydrolase activator NlpD n=1 Tax=Agitococcus lubricus TaxID=1077255 RepID=A0A2T5J0J6_9GAMM|nr:M23 family metallopeptidase [Agitococcus lubricus]PTQ89863.1 murein DD-endopeptidase MepM/ murein hydrolase activator NlpD [Agitococcus lubricus]